MLDMIVVEYSHQLLIVVPLAVGTDHVSLELFYSFFGVFFAPKVLNCTDLHFLFFALFWGLFVCFFHISQQ